MPPAASQANHARVAFEFELRDPKAGSTVWTRYYAHDEPVDGKDARSGCCLESKCLERLERVKRRTGPVFFYTYSSRFDGGPLRQTVYNTLGEQAHPTPCTHKCSVVLVFSRCYSC